MPWRSKREIALVATYKYILDQHTYLFKCIGNRLIVHYIIIAIVFALEVHDINLLRDTKRIHLVNTFERNPSFNEVNGIQLAPQLAGPLAILLAKKSEPKKNPLDPRHPCHPRSMFRVHLSFAKNNKMKSLRTYLELIFN